MTRHWTFGRKIGVGFSFMAALTIALGVVAYLALSDVVESKDRVIQEVQPLLVNAEKLETAAEQKVAASRGYLLTGDQPRLDAMAKARDDFFDAFGAIEKSIDRIEQRSAFGNSLGNIKKAEEAYQKAQDAVIELKSQQKPLAEVAQAFEERALPKRQELKAAIQAFSEKVDVVVTKAQEESSQAATAAVNLMVGMALLITLFGAGAAFALSRSLARQVGSAVSQVQSSSAELQAAANQQATGAREQATAMSEITTTISELLATSRQIAESALRVSEIAEETSIAARGGDGTVGSAQEMIAGIKRQVEQIVSHMLELGKRSQQIGSVLDIVAELAEQTNILAINATIEAAGAGEAGRRFAVVADEIRKLADRVAGSTKEIRTLVDDVRGAVNTTVMATETGSKAVEAGSRQFGEVAQAFRSITGLVTTTTEAAREIELSTKQQSTAVEQVNVAIANVAQATRETEASSAQTLQTASQLAALSKELLRLVQPRTTN